MIYIVKLWDGKKFYFKGYAGEWGDTSIVPYWTTTRDEALQYEDMSDAESQLESLNDKDANIEII
jgi:hypothetical protein